MSSAMLTSNAIASLHSDEKGEFAVQVLTVKPFKETGRYSCTLTDGTTKTKAMTTKTSSLLFKDGDVEDFGVVKILEWTTNEVRGEKVVIMLQAEVVCKSLGEEVGAVAAAVTPAPKVARTEKNSAPSSSSSPPSNAKPIVQRSMTSGSRRVQPISSLNPYAPSWTIKARVTSKSDMRVFNRKTDGQQAKVFNIELVDEQGTEIQATMWHEVADRCFAQFQVNKVYFISKGTLKPANRQYSQVNNQYELTINERTEIDECMEEASFPVVPTYNLVSFGNLAAQIDGKNSFDVMGVVQTVGELGSVKRKSDGNELFRRDITLVDSESRSVHLTVWNRLATEEPGPELASKMSSGENVVLLAKNLRATSYNGVSISTVARSQLFLNPECSEAAELRTWYEGGGKDAPTVAAGAGLSTALGPGSLQGTKSNLKEMQPEELAPASAAPEFFVMRSTVCRIKPDQPMYYLACPEEGLNYKVVEENGGYWCEANQKRYPNFKRRYIMSFQAMDNHASCWVSTFNEQAEAILGQTADELAELRECDSKRYERTLKEACWRSYNMRFKVKTDEYNG
ncbi:Replication protein A 70 kDa DNA-binding subunit B [Cymbomonas tetramitiformis]|nr:Replication protein A 70 kDa DNA-binding subunit B [Cymbomonas tetramitiformis]